MKIHGKNKVRLLICIVVLLSLCTIYLVSNTNKVGESKVSNNQNIEVENRVINSDIKSIVLDESVEGFTYYDLARQDEIQNQIDEYQAANVGIDDMLLLFNPYGTNTTGLYVYFNEKDITKVEYTIETENYENYSQSVRMDEDLSNVEFQLIGLVAGEENQITIHCYQDDNVIENVTFSVTAPSLQGNYVNQIEVDCEDYDLLENGLYALLGLNYTYEGYTYFVDKYGVVRMEYSFDEDLNETILIHDNHYFTSFDLHSMAKINNLGKVVNVYDLNEYEIHHDYAINDDDEIIVLVTDTSSNAVEDEIIKVDIETGEVSLLLDLGTVFYDYKQITNVFADDSIWQNYVGQLDWMHINSLQLVNDDEIILSSRETSTIIKLSNIYENVEIDYLISDEEIWEDTAYAQYSYTQIGDFIPNAGQHSVTYLEDDALESGQYYLYMYNNNYFNYESRLSYEETIEGANTTFDNTGTNQSMYYMYLVDENEETYTLVNQIDVEYSSIVSSAQKYVDEIIINSGMEKEFYVYDEDNNVIATYYYNDLEESIFLGYRVFKYSFEDFYFE